MPKDSSIEFCWHGGRFWKGERANLHGGSEGFCPEIWRGKDKLARRNLGERERKIEEEIRKAVIGDGASERREREWEDETNL